MLLFMKERKTRFRKKVSTVWGSPRPLFTSFVSTIRKSVFCLSRLDACSDFNQLLICFRPLVVVIFWEIFRKIRVP